MTRTRSELLAEISATQAKLTDLYRDLALLPSDPSPPTTAPPLSFYTRYSRQLLLPALGLPGQLTLSRSHVLVIGAGGLGCPVLMYLAAAGVGEITVLDRDCVEVSNLHRQVLHTEARVGVNKAVSAAVGMHALNSTIRVNPLPINFHPSLFLPSAASSTPQTLLHPTFSLILDCTDNPASRQFLNAYSAVHGIPLVSGGAVRTDGTVGVFNMPLRSTPASATSNAPPPSTSRQTGPCYACVFPPSTSSPSSQTPEQRALLGTGACSDEGVLGVLCGVVGLGMASEALRVLLGLAKPTLHLYSPLSAAPYRTIKLRPAQPTCPTCSAPDSAFSKFIETTNPEDDVSCALEVGYGVVRDEGHGIEATELRELLQTDRVRVVDTRSETEFGIVSLPGSQNIPLRKILQEPSEAALFPSPSSNPATDLKQKPITVLVCRRGNDSILAARALRNAGMTEVRDLVGGLEGGWGRMVASEGREWIVY